MLILCWVTCSGRYNIGESLWACLKKRTDESDGALEIVSIMLKRRGEGKTRKWKKGKHLKERKLGERVGGSN